MAARFVETLSTNLLDIFRVIITIEPASVRIRVTVVVSDAAVASATQRRMEAIASPSSLTTLLSDVDPGLQVTKLEEQPVMVSASELASKAVSKSNLSLPLVIAVAAGALTVIALAMVIYCFVQRRRRKWRLAMASVTRPDADEPRSLKDHTKRVDSVAVPADAAQRPHQTRGRMISDRV